MNIAHLGRPGDGMSYGAVFHDNGSLRLQAVISRFSGETFSFAALPLMTCGEAAGAERVESSREGSGCCAADTDCLSGQAGGVTVGEGDRAPAGASSAPLGEVATIGVRLPYPRRLWLIRDASSLILDFLVRCMPARDASGVSRPAGETFQSALVTGGAALVKTQTRRAL